MAASKNYIRTDERGVLRVGSTRISLDSVVHSFLQGSAPETIADQYPALSLEEVYGAIAYFLANREEVDRYLKQQDAVWAAMRAEAEGRPAAVVARLRALKKDVA